MKAGKFIVFAGMLCWAVLAHAGELRVSGPVSGTWHDGDRVIVEDRAWVPLDEILTVEPGVNLIFETDAEFDVFGNFEMIGRSDAPIIIEAVDGWLGIRYINSEDWNRLSYVQVVTTSGLPRRVLTADNSRIDLVQCSFHASYQALAVTGGHLRAQSNKFYTHEKYSRTVQIIDLDIGPYGDCENPNGNVFRYNFVKAFVPESDIEPNPFDITAGLYIVGSTNICISENDIQVHSEGTTVGAWFGMPPNIGGTTWLLNDCLFLVSSVDEPAHGVRNTFDGVLRLENSHVEVSVTDGESLADASGVVAYGQAQVTVNTTFVQTTDEHDSFFRGQDGGLVVVDYSQVWRDGDSQISAPGPDLPMGRDESHGEFEFTDFGPGVIAGEHVYEGDPEFVRDGIPPLFNGQDDVRRFYALLPTSPLIDRGDPTIGLDPDGTVPDIGRYYFDSIISDVPDQGGSAIAVNSLLPAYPNPFNPSTTIPFEIATPGHVRIGVYDILGREIVTLFDGFHSAGRDEFHFEAASQPSGMFFVRLEQDGVPVSLQKLILMK